MSEPHSEKRLHRGRELVAIGVLLALAGLYFAVLELREPYYFLWDDNAAFYLPSYVYNYDSVIGRFELPHLNYHQYLGHPHLASGQTGVLYPPLYLGLLLTRLFCGDLRAAVDVLAILHFLLAALGMYLLLRRFKIDRTTALLTSLLWITFPFLLVVARSWIFVAYAAALLPFGLWALERLLERPTGPRILVLAAIKALFLYQGYVQYAVLATLYEGAYLVLRWLVRREEWKGRALSYLAALAATVAIAAPILFPMIHAKEVSAYRTGSLSYEEFISNSLPLEAFFSAQVFHMEPRAVHLSTGAIFYIGLPNLIAFGALFFSPRRKLHVVCGLVALLALILSTQAFGIMYHAPLLSSFRWPFKSFLIALFFLIIAIAASYARWAGAARRAVRLAGVLLLIAGVAGNAAIVFSKTLDSPFGPNRVAQEISELREEARRFPIDRGRVVSLWLSPLEPGIERFLAFQYATLVGAYHLGGYDPLISEEHLKLALRLEYSNIFRYELTREMLDYLSSWSVRFFLVPESRMFPQIDRLRGALDTFPELRLSYREDGLEVWENGAAKPFAYFVDAEDVPVRISWGTSSLRLKTAGRGGWLRVNVAPLAWYVWSADGREMGAVEYDEKRHLVIHVPEGTAEVGIRYVDVPFILGVSLSFAFLLLLILLRAFLRHRRELLRKTAV